MINRKSNPKCPLDANGNEVKYWRLIGPKGLDFKDVVLHCTEYMDFSEAKNLTWEQIIEANNITYMKLPEMDFKGVKVSSFKGKLIIGIDFSKVKNLTWKQIVAAKNISSIILPEIDFKGVSFKDRDISGVDFSKVKNLTWKQILEAKQMSRLILPDYLK